MPVAFTLEEIQRIGQQRLIVAPDIFTEKPTTPDNIQVTGGRNLLRVQWTPVSGVDGYRVAVMTDQNLDAPDVDLTTIWGEKSREYIYNTGNTKLTRYFAVQSFKGAEFSEFTSVTSGTSSNFGTLLNNDTTRASRSTTGTLRSYTLPGGTLGNNDYLKILATGERDGTAAIMTIQLRWGTTVISTVSLAAAANTPWQMNVVLSNRNATNSQISTGLSYDTGFDTHTFTTASLDTTSNQTIDVNVSSINAADTAHCDLFDIKHEIAGTDSAPSSALGNPPSSSEPPDVTPRGTG